MRRETIEHRVGCRQDLLPGRGGVVRGDLDVFLMQDDRHHIKRNLLDLVNVRGECVPKHMRFERQRSPINGLKDQAVTEEAQASRHTGPREMAIAELKEIGTSIREPMSSMVLLIVDDVWDTFPCLKAIVGLQELADPFKIAPGFCSHNVICGLV